MSEVLPEWLVDYVLKRDQQRADEVNAVLGALTDRERRLVRDAAVTGYAHGQRHPAGADHPKDSTVVADVVASCPEMSSLPDRERRLVRDAAVMAYVHGRRHMSGTGSPNDATVVGNVIAACLVHADLYPVLSGVQPCGECGHPQYNHSEGDDPVTPGACLKCASEKSDEAHHDFRRKN